MADGGYSEMASLMGTMVTLVLVILLAWWLLRWLTKRVPMQTGSKHIKILDRVPVSQDKCLLLVRVADKTMLVAMTSHTAEKLCDVENLDEETLVPAPVSFRSLFAQRMQGKEEEQ